MAKWGGHGQVPPSPLPGVSDSGPRHRAKLDPAPRAALQNASGFLDSEAPPGQPRRIGRARRQQTRRGHIPSERSRTVVGRGSREGSRIDVVGVPTGRTSFAVGQGWSEGSIVARGSPRSILPWRVTAFVLAVTSLVYGQTSGTASRGCGATSGAVSAVS
jgi:hypothetical protein